jgi:hypothetical protein
VAPTTARAGDDTVTANWMRRSALVALVASACVEAQAATPITPEIRTSASNRVPACVTPDRLMVFIKERNPKLEPRFQDIAQHYKRHGESNRIRWDYAFYQMILETNYLMFRRGDGKPGDVRARQNNFAGIGATGGGVPGDSYPDVSTGVLAQMQHLVAYSGERVPAPVAPRTREVQEKIVADSLRLGRAVRFGDLTNRWAADRNYSRSIETVADRFREAHCADATTVAATVPPPAPPKPARPGGATALSNQAAVAAPSKASAVPAKVDCTVMTASYGGDMTLLIRLTSPAKVTFTALEVKRRDEKAMADGYMRVHAPGGSVVGRFESRQAAVAAAYDRCDSGKP